jgi:glucosamine-6-phosphate deaminase
MPRAISKAAPGWWDFTTLDPEILGAAASLDATGLIQLSRPGFQVHFHDTLEDFYLAAALEYVSAFKKSTADNPCGLCGPIGPTEQLPLVARIINDLQIDVREGHFWGMDEWVHDGKSVDERHPLSFKRTDMEMCFNRIDGNLRMPDSHLHFPVGDLGAYSRSFDSIKCLTMQGGQGEVKHWAFNDPPKREGKYVDAPPSPAEYRKLAARIVDLHPMTIIQNARTSSGGQVAMVPSQAATVGPVETWKSEAVSIWHPGLHDYPLGIRLTALMISRKIPDTAVPMSLLADHPNVHFHYYRGGLGSTRPEMR